MSPSSTDNLHRVGQVLKSNGADGGLVIKLDYATPEDTDLKEPVFIEFDGEPVPFFFRELLPKGNRAVARFHDVDDFEDSEELVGKILYGDNPGDPSEGREPDDIIGWTVTDEHGNPRGIIRDYEDIPGNPCIIVEGRDGGQSMIPLHEDLILETDAELKSLKMIIPEGL